MRGIIRPYIYDNQFSETHPDLLSIPVVPKWLILFWKKEPYFLCGSTMWFICHARMLVIAEFLERMIAATSKSRFPNSRKEDPLLF